MMTQEQGIMEGNVQHKLSSAGFIIGAILFGIGGLLMPHAAKPTSDLQEMLKPLGEDPFLTNVSSLLTTIGFWAALIGVTGVYRSMIASGATWARLGFYFTLIGTALWTVSFSLDVSTASAVANWLSAPADGKETAWGIVAAISAVGRGVLPMTWIVYWMALAFLDVGMLGSAVYPRWLGWAGLIVSTPVIALGIVQIFTPRTITLTLIFALLMMLTALWNLVTGVWIARRAWRRSVMNHQTSIPFWQQWFFRGKQWLYRGRRPNWIAKMLNGMWARTASKSVMSNGLIALEVVGRKSGRIVSFPLVMVKVDGNRYVASMLGDNTQWVRNVRASGGRAILRSGGYEEVHLAELPARERAPILKAYLQLADGARPHIPVNKDAPVAEFEKIAADYPVFRLDSFQPG
jgi:hypothetical protein